MCDSNKVDSGDKVCRSCLINAKNMKSLTDPYSTEMCVADVFTYITSLKCSEDNDVLPTQICRECFGTLHSSYQFVLKSRASDKQLQAYLNKIKNAKIADNTRQISDVTITDGVTTSSKSGHNMNALIDERQLDVQTELNNFSNDLTLSNRELSAEYRIKLEEHQSNDGTYEHSYEPIKMPLLIVEMQEYFDQELDLIKHEIKTEISNDINYENSITINIESANEQDIALTSATHQIASNITSDVNNEMENELNDSLLTIDTNESTLFNENDAETSNVIQLSPKQSSQSGHLLNSMSPRVVLERLNMNFISTSYRTHNQCKQTNTVASTETNKTPTANIEMTSSDHEQQLPKNRRHIEIQGETKNVCIKTAKRSYSCTFCKKSFSDKFKLANHRRMHIREYTCAVCKKSFSYRRSLVRHVRTHTGDKPFSCTSCDKSFSRNSHLVSHTRTHIAKKLYSCTTCSKTFSQKSRLIRHTRMHTGEKPFSCSSCKKSFSRKSILVQHTRTHTDVKPHMCTTCNKSFNQKSHLDRHTRTHTGEKPYSCTSCKKLFGRKSTLVEHMRTHTGVKPYSCTICKKSFKHRKALARHTRTHDEEDQ